MFASRQVPQSDVLVQLHSAKRVFVRLALSHQEQGGWLARGLVVDILPQRWLDNPNISQNITGPWWKPTYLFDAERAIFFRGFLSGSQVYDWFTSPAGSALAGFDRWPGHGSHKDSFALPDLRDPGQEQRQ